MRNVDEQIKISSDAISKLIENLDSSDRGFMSQNILTNLRTLVEAVSVKLAGETEYSYDIFQNKGKHYISTKANLKFLGKFHQFLQQTLSHYLPDEERSERLMLKYYEYLLKLKKLFTQVYQVNILSNLSKFPTQTDPALLEYYKKISEKVEQKKNLRQSGTNKDRYYIKKIKPFFVDQEIYYEVTFTSAIDNTSKFDRVIAFTHLDILPNYAVKLSISNDEINVLGKKMPIQIIEDWEVSIRPCEINHFASLFGTQQKISGGSKEIWQLMQLMTKTSLNLVNVIDFPDVYYERFKAAVLKDAKVSHFFDILDRARYIIINEKPGANILRYLLYELNNKTIKLQYDSETCPKLSNLKLKWSIIPFDNMPFNMSPSGHNPRIRDLLSCIDFEKHSDELLARRVRNNIEQEGRLYTPVAEIKGFNDLQGQISKYNQRLYSKHQHAKLELYKDHIYIKGYEEDTVQIIEKLKEMSSSGVKNYSNSVDTWLKSNDHGVDSPEKKEILKQIFENSHVAMVYGSAGTGKTTLINHISTFHKDLNKLFLANTNPAVSNLDRRITSGNSTFMTIAKFLSDRNTNIEYDLVIVDECSTVSNSDMLKIINKGKFILLVLVGDIYQIESILFGNWFGIVKALLPSTSVHELTTPFRTSNTDLLALWSKVRNIDEDILENLTNNHYSSTLDETIFDHSEDDEIILCLNYDGLYGINNINRFLQANNASKTIQWGLHTYKVGDPILFNESDRFKPLIYNNLKGWIREIEVIEDKIQFDIEIDKSINELDTFAFMDLELLDEVNEGKSIIRFTVDRLQSTDEDENTSNSTVPFQIAYAVSIHKAQGLEYKSVKVVITDESDEMITHNIFYTAITRAREKLKIFWTPETENRVLSNLQKKFNGKDLSLLKNKFNYK